MSASTPEARERTQNWPRMRPRFVVELGCRPHHVMEALREGASPSEPRIEGRFSDRHGVLTIPEGERRFWSTQLGITVADAPSDSDGRQPTRVSGVFSPSPELWTGYVFAIGTLALVALCGALYATVQLAMGDPPWAALVSLIAVLIGALLYTSTLVGQGLAAGEMYRLRSHLDARLEEAEARALREPSTARDSAYL